MNDIQVPLSKNGISIRWITQLLSIIVSCSYLFIVFLAVANEDKPQGMAISVLVLLALTIAGCFVAWRWERIGGVVIVISALCLSVVVYSASLNFGLGSLSFLPSLIYGIPFLAVGILFWICGQRVEIASTE
jgi:hypothetical protein